MGSDLLRNAGADPTLIGLLAATHGFTAERLDGLVRWWQRASHPNESLPDFLVRYGICGKSTRKTLDTVRRGYVQLPDASSLLAADGLSRLDGFLFAERTETISNAAPPTASTLDIPAYSAAASTHDVPAYSAAVTPADGVPIPPKGFAAAFETAVPIPSAIEKSTLCPVESATEGPSSMWLPPVTVAPPKEVFGTAVVSWLESTPPTIRPGSGSFSGDERFAPLADSLADKQPSWRGSEASSTSLSDPLVDRSLGGFRLERLVGEGPTGSVYEAFDPVSHKQCAIKVLGTGEQVAQGLSPAEDLRRRDRFFQEARTAAGIGHPDGLPVWQAGEQGDVCFLLMPWFAEPALDRIVADRGPLSLPDAAFVLRRATRLIAYLHSQGLVHGNLKLSNLRPQDGQVFISDFGMSRVADERAVERDKRYDLLSLGVLFGALLSGTNVRPDLWLVRHREDFEAGRCPLLTGAAGMVFADLLRGTIATADRLVEVFEKLEGAAARWNSESSAAPAPLPPANPPTPRHWTAPEITTARASTSSSHSKSRSTAAGHVIDHSRSVDPGRAAPGSVLGKCLLLEQLGAGANCVVFRAQHRTLNIPVALKVFHTEALQDMPERFEVLRAEAQMLARINHPHIVHVLDFEDDPELPFIVLEYVEGASLEQLLRRAGRLPVDRAVRLAIQATQGLEAAQQLGLVHRDIKPDNLLLTHDGNVKIADFGMASLAAGTAQDHSQAGFASSVSTRSSASRIPVEMSLGTGTPAYMAPEQTGGPEVTVDFRADIYALGVTLFQCLTGDLPYQGRTPLEMLVKHCRDAVPDAHRLVPEVPVALAQVVRRMMAKDPAARYGSYDELRTALTASLTGPARGGWTGLFGLFGKRG